MTDPTGTPVHDLGRPRVVHIVGVGGAGMSAIATVLVRMGHEVSGSDLKDSPVLERLRLQGVAVMVGHAGENIREHVDFVCVSTAVPDHNPEVRAAVKRGVPVLRRAELLGLITRSRRTIAVSGTHGKTTTSSMLALVLREAGWKPSFIIGGEVNEVGGNAAYDEGDWLVVEADESDGTFVELDREVAVVTNVEPDHLEHYGDFDALLESFRRFVARASRAVVWADDATTEALAHGHPGAVTFGFSAGAMYRIHDYRTVGGGSRFDLRGPEGLLGTVELPVPGRHHVLDAAAAAVTAVTVGAPFRSAAAALRRFTGVSRRFEFRGTVDGVTIIDDYAHLPSEIAAAISAARDAGFERVVAVFQPHRFSRTEHLWRDFAGAFDGADLVVLTDVYPAGEAPRPGVSGRLVLRAVTEARPGLRVVYLPRRQDLERWLPRLAHDADALLTLGAGDITSVADGWLVGAGEAVP